MMKRFFAVVLALIMLLLLATAAPLSIAQEEMSGYLSWDFLTDQRLVNEDQAAFYFSFQGGKISTPGAVLESSCIAR